MIKRIPSQAGLGGGSSDAAATLVGLAAMWRLPLPLDRLAAVGATLGADVPFFLYGGTALGQGIGERVFPLVDLPKRYVVLAQPARDLVTECAGRREGAHVVRPGRLALAHRVQVDRDPVPEAHRRFAPAPHEGIAQADDRTIRGEHLGEPVVGAERAAGGRDDEKRRKPRITLPECDRHGRTARLCRRFAARERVDRVPDPRVGQDRCRRAHSNTPRRLPLEGTRSRSGQRQRARR
mgnify:CR=1 FL=1